MYTDEDLEVVCILGNTGREAVWSFVLTFKTEGVQTLTTDKSSGAKYCKGVS